MCFKDLLWKENFKKESVVNIMSALCFLHFSFFVAKVNL